MTPPWLIFLLLLALTLGAQAYLTATHARYARVPNRLRLTGAEVARALLLARGLGRRVAVERVPGYLTDHYDPLDKAVRLSDAHYHGTSLAALAVAAHEVGHAVQDARGYAPLVARARLAPALAVGANAGPWLVLLGLLAAAPGLAWFGAALFGAPVLFHLLTLPVEFDASRRALVPLTRDGYVVVAERDGARAVLAAAALTYVAAAVGAIVQLLHLLALARGGLEEDYGG